MNKKIYIKLLVCLIIISLVMSYTGVFADTNNPLDIPEPINEGTRLAERTIITISAAGDITLGRDANASYTNSLEHELALQKSNYSYFLERIKPIFERDDLTIANLEAPFTTACDKALKLFRFKAKPEYTEILKQGSVEAVNLANNHIFDYLEKGYTDTVLELTNSQIGYFGFEHQYVTEIKGIKVGLLGYTGWENSKQKKVEIKKAVDSLKEKGVSIIIVSFHWGEEGKHFPNTIQKDLGHYCIDIGCDLVLGHHPHVIQGVEQYKGKSIVYSLGNFCFGGNKNPSDKAAYIYQHSFWFKENVLDAEEGQIIPISISSVSCRNNYQPIPLQGAEEYKTMNMIQQYSMGL